MLEEDLKLCYVHKESWCVIFKSSWSNSVDPFFFAMETPILSSDFRYCEKATKFEKKNPTYIICNVKT